MLGKNQGVDLTIKRYQKSPTRSARNGVIYQEQKSLLVQTSCVLSIQDFHHCSQFPRSKNQTPRTPPPPPPTKKNYIQCQQQKVDDIGNVLS